MSFSIFIPCYNAELTLPAVIKRIYATKLSFDYIIIVDDGSSDNSVALIKKFKRQYKEIVLLEHKSNKGYGAAQKTAYKYCILHKIPCIAMIHSDGQYPVELLNELVHPILHDGVDLVGGSRILSDDVKKTGMPRHKLLGNLILTWFQNLIFRKNYHIYHSGFKAYSLKLLKNVPFENYSNSYMFDTELIVGSFIRDLNIVEFPIPCTYGNEKSYLNEIEYGLGILSVVLKFIFRKKTY